VVKACKLYQAEPAAPCAAERPRPRALGPHSRGAGCVAPETPRCIRLPQRGERDGSPRRDQKDWASIIKAAGISDLRVHDLRHSYASSLVSSGATLPLIGAMLGHASPTTTARYSHLFQDPQRAAAERIGSLIENATMPPEPEKVVPLGARGRS
jgi:integrase